MSKIRFKKDYISYRYESWGGLLLDERYDRIWGFSNEFFHDVIKLIESKILINSKDFNTNKNALIDIIEYLGPNIKEKNPYRYKEIFFKGKMPKKNECSLSAPISLSWAITDLCNSSCIFCCTNPQNNHKKEMSTTEIYDIIPKISKWGVLRLIIGGGEPLIRSDICEILYRISLFGIKPTLATNGTILDQKILECLNDTCSCVQISFDSLNEEKYKFLRGCNLLQNVKRNIEILCKKNFNLRIVTVLNHHNEYELEEIAEFIIKFGIKQWFIFALLPSGRAKEKYKDLKVSDYNNAKDRIRILTDKYKNLSIWLWGVKKDDTLAVYINSDGSLNLYDYSTNSIKSLSFSKDNDIKQLHDSWSKVLPEAKYSTLKNFTDKNRCF